MDDALRRAFEAGLPYTSLLDFTPEEGLASAVGLERARLAGIVPLLVIGDRLKVAAAKPLPAVEELARDLPGVTGVDVVLAPEAAIEAALERAARARLASSPQRLGELLLVRGAASSMEVAEALAEQAQTGGRLGDVLLARGAVSEDDLVRTLAEQFGLPVVDDPVADPDPAAIALIPEQLQRRERFVPLACDEHSIFLAVVDPLDARAAAEVREHAGREPRLFLASRGAVDELLWTLHAERWSTAVRSRVAPPAAPRDPVTLMPLVPGMTPAVTVILLLEGGAGSAIRAAATVAALAHPRSRLEVLLLVRADEGATLRAARGLARRPPHRLVPLPASLPATRGAALAYGALVARGELIAVLEPGDVPLPDLLAGAGAALAAAGPRAGAAHAADADDRGGIAGRLRRNPSLRTNIVVRADALEAAGSWSPDGDGADLGPRLRACGLRILELEDAVGGHPVG